MKKIVWLCLPLMMVLAGCSVNSKTDYCNNARQLTIGTNILTIGVMAGKIQGAEADVVSTVVHVAHNCSTTWYFYIKDGNNPPPDVMDCAMSAVGEILFWQQRLGVTGEESYSNSRFADQYIATAKPEPVKEATDEDVELAKRGLDLAVIRFDAAVDSILPIPEHHYGLRNE